MYIHIIVQLTHFPCGFPGGSAGKESTCNVGDPGSIAGLGRSPGEGNGNPLQYPCLENPMDGGAWQATVLGITKSQTWMKRLTLLPTPVFWSGEFRGLYSPWGWKELDMTEQLSLSQHISRTFSSCKTETLDLLNNCSHFPLSSRSTTISTFCFWEFYYFGSFYKWNRASLIAQLVKNLPAM